MKFVCPKPTSWNTVYYKLMTAWEEGGCVDEPPPVPLIMAEWYSSSDYDKFERWQETLRWVEERKMLPLIPRFPDPEKYKVRELSSLPETEILQEAGSAPLSRLSQEDVQNLVEGLKENWATIVGDLLAQHCEPVMFAGNRKKRLVVETDRDFTPPWGSWFTLPSDERRQTFVEFRAAINKAIAPHSVDYIKFEVK